MKVFLIMLSKLLQEAFRQNGAVEKKEDKGNENERSKPKEGQRSPRMVAEEDSSGTVMCQTRLGGSSPEWATRPEVPRAGSFFQVMKSTSTI